MPTIRTHFIVYLMSILSVVSSNAIAETTVQTEQAAQIEQLQEELTQLKKQVVILNRNQQGIAKHIGITKNANKQPLLPINNSARLGKADAKVVLVEFTDLHCPFCKRFNEQIMPALMDKYIDTGKVQFIGKSYPIVSLHKNAYTAALALECARAQEPANQKKYSTAKSWLFTKGKKFTSQEFLSFTNDLNLKSDEFEKCVVSEDTKQLIQNDLALVKEIGLKSTPSFAVGLLEEGNVAQWKTFSGAKTIEQFSQAIDDYLLKVTK